jgi:hypothetical protein
MESLNLLLLGALLGLLVVAFRPQTVIMPMPVPTEDQRGGGCLLPLGLLLLGLLMALLLLGGRSL